MPNRKFEVVHGDVGIWKGPTYQRANGADSAANNSPTYTQIAPGEVFTEDQFRLLHPCDGIAPKDVEKFYAGVFKRLMEPTPNGVPARIRVTDREPTNMEDKRLVFGTNVDPPTPYVDPAMVQMAKIAQAVAAATVAAAQGGK